MSASKQKNIAPSVFKKLFLIAILPAAIIISGYANIAFPSNVSAAPTASTQASCEAAGGTWGNQAPTGGVPEMGCSGVGIAQQQSLDWQVKSLLYYRAMGKCFQQASRASIDAAHITSGEWFQDGDAAIGPYMADSLSDVGDDSVMSCSGDSGKQLVNQSLALWGIKPIDLLCGAGYTWKAFPNNTARCASVTAKDGISIASSYWGDGTMAGSGTQGYISDKTSSVLSYIRDQMYGSKTPELTEAGWYTFYKKVFFQTCDTTQKISEGSTTTPPGADARDVKLTIVENDGSSADKWYRIDASMMNGSSYNSFKTRLGDYSSFSDVNKNCKEIADYINGLAKFYAVTVKADPAKADPAADGPTTGADDSVSSCAIEAVGWILCPAINFLAGITDNCFIFLSDTFLRTDPKAFDTSQPTYAAWSVMRNIANVLFVIAFLFIVFSQLTGMGVSNYGVKKMLPRIVVAAILVNISYFIAQVAIDLSNILGYSLRDVFGGVSEQIKDATSASKDSVSNFATGGGGGFETIAGVIIAGTLAVGTVYLLLSSFLPILLAAAIALIMVLFLLVARQAIIVLLVVLSPIAFVAFLLPNTEFLFKQWRKMLTTMLLLFPIIALIFGASGLASTLLQQSFTGAISGEGSNVFGQIIASAVLILPLFAIPGLLKKSLDKIPVVGQSAGRWANKAFGGVGNKAKESYQGSTFARGKAIRKNAKDTYRTKKFAGKISRGGFLGTANRIAASGIPILPIDKAANKTLVKSAVATNVKAQIEEREEAKTFIENANLSGAQRQELATKGTTSYLDEKGRTRTVSGEAYQKGAIDMQLKTGSMGQRLEIIQKSSDTSDTGLYAHRQLISQGVINNGIAAGDPALAGVSLDEISQGTFNLDAARERAIREGKVNAEALAGMHDDVRDKYVDMAEASAIAGNLNQMDILRSAKDGILTSPQLLAKVSGNSRADTALGRIV